MPAFYLLVGIGIVILWFFVSGLYKPIGRYIQRIFFDSVDAMKDEEENNENKN